MNRYQTLTQSDNARYYGIAIPTSIPLEEVPFYYIASAGDRLDTLAHRFYGTPTKWWILAKANNLVNGSLSVSAGQKLMIPNV